MTVSYLRKIVTALSLLAGFLLLFLIGNGNSAAIAPAQEGGQEIGQALIRAHDNTSFPLEGWHRVVECGACHLGGIIGGTPEACEACHWDRRRDDPYDLQLGTNCGECHASQSWKRLNPGSWIHEKVTGFRLEGQHRTVECRQCHSSGSFGGSTTECSACHAAEFQSAGDPDHLAANFPTDCELCHPSAVTWEGAVFNHSLFPLVGEHQVTDCLQCHSSGQYAGTSSECTSCHFEDYLQTTNPNHQQAQFPNDCSVCHGATADSWQGATFEHSLVWPLTGQHRTTDCSLCHPNGRYSGTPTGCVDCHHADYDGTINPNHHQAGFPTDCESCHGASATSWTDANLDHDRIFPLSGRHRAADCSLCHPDGRFAGTPTTCIDCHQADYDGTTNPNHQKAGFPIDCESCHGASANNWAGATFNHNLAWPLNGQHRSTEL